MTWWLWLLDAVGAVLLLVVLAGAALVVRRRLLERQGGTFELSLLPPSGHRDASGWTLGLGRYREDSLEWFRIFSPLPRPTRSWRRHELVVLEQRESRSTESHAIGSQVVVRCETPQGEVELALSASSLTGLSSWLEAGPPGSRRAS